MASLLYFSLEYLKEKKEIFFVKQIHFGIVVGKREGDDENADNDVYYCHVFRYSKVIATRYHCVYAFAWFFFKLGIAS